jgi:hypothetical protein
MRRIATIPEARCDSGLILTFPPVPGAWIISPPPTSMPTCQGGEGDLRLQPGQRGAQAVVHAMAEAQVAGGITADVEHAGVGEPVHSYPGAGISHILEVSESARPAA